MSQGSAALANGRPDTADQTTARVIASAAGPLTLHVNGRTVTVLADPATTLVQVLRDGLGLTGTKIGCDRGACSACTVWLDGEVASSCMTLAFDARHRRVTTIEGLADGDRLHPVQRAFVDHDAMQCGFCTPGMVMSCGAGRSPSRLHAGRREGGGERPSVPMRHLPQRVCRDARGGGAGGPCRSRHSSRIGNASHTPTGRAPMSPETGSQNHAADAAPSKPSEAAGAQLRRPTIQVRFATSRSPTASSARAWAGSAARCR
jgi:aerobic-type carbon monoxide dehydrogenase small subunit (CoxS/CutS family)